LKWLERRWFETIPQQKFETSAAQTFNLVIAGGD
jgi:hypothetical protein